MYEFCAQHMYRPACVYCILSYSLFFFLQKICPPQPRCLSWPSGPMFASLTSASPALPMPHNSCRVEELIHSDCYVTDGLCYNLSICKGIVIAVIEELGYSKVCDKWVPRILRYASKETVQQSKLIFCTNTTWKWGLSTANYEGDETWVHHIVPESKRPLMK